MLPQIDVKYELSLTGTRFTEAGYEDHDLNRDHHDYHFLLDFFMGNFRRETCSGNFFGVFSVGKVEWKSFTGNKS